MWLEIPDRRRVNQQQRAGRGQLGGHTEHVWILELVTGAKRKHLQNRVECVLSSVPDEVISLFLLSLALVSLCLLAA